PRDPCDSLLDLCCGSAIEALACAPSARRVWACDRAPRSIHFASFNCLLNGVENVACARSDVYEAVKAMTFDRIVAHPPSVPETVEDAMLCRDGGDDSEQVLRAIVEGLPRYLRPGGLFYSFAMSTDGESGTLTDRIRQWLGAETGDFEITLTGAGDAFTA